MDALILACVSQTKEPSETGGLYSRQTWSPWLAEDQSNQGEVRESLGEVIAFQTNKAWQAKYYFGQHPTKQQEH